MPSEVLAVGESTEDLYAMADVSALELPAEKPRYLMGVGLARRTLSSVLQEELICLIV